MTQTRLLPDREQQWPTDLPRTSSLDKPHSGVLRTVRPLAAAAFRARWSITSHDVHHVPRRGPVILAANHLGVLDGPLLVGLAPRLTFALAKNQLFSGRWGGLLEAVGQIPVDQRQVDPGALRRALGVLQHGQTLAIFPEGGRAGGDVRRIKGGVAYLAMASGAPVVPVALLGTRESGAGVKTVPPRGARMHIVYGEPIEFPRVGWPRRREPLARVSEQVRQHLADLVAYAQQRTGMELPGEPAPRVDRESTAGG